MRSQGKLYPHVYPKLITKELFDKYENVRLNKGKQKYKRTFKPFIFRGLIRCHHCNCSYSPDKQKKKYIYIRPVKRKNTCDKCAYIKEEVILKEISNAIDKLNIPDEILLEITNNLNNEILTQKKQ